MWKSHCTAKTILRNEEWKRWDIKIWVKGMSMQTGNKLLIFAFNCKEIHF